MSWTRFLVTVLAYCVAVNAGFGLAYALLGPGSLESSDPSLGSGFARGFFFSVETFSTVGYGNISPRGIAANALVLVEILTGLMSITLATGMLFARIARPTARILFSKTAVIAPYRGITALEFRIANVRRNQILELGAKVILSRIENGARRFHTLDLERSSVAFFPLSWTVVHPIEEASPLHGQTPELLKSNDTELLILLTGIDETFAQSASTRARRTSTTRSSGTRGSRAS
jgi:inward rectifier potassium channel